MSSSSEIPALRISFEELYTDAGIARIVKFFFEEIDDLLDPKTGDFRPLSVLLSKDHGLVQVPFTSLALTDTTRKAWLSDIRHSATRLSAFAAITMVRSKFRWKGKDNVHDVIAVVVDHDTLGVLPWVAEVERVDGRWKIGALTTLAQLAKREVGANSARVTGATGQFARILPKHWAN